MTSFTQMHNDYMDPDRHLWPEEAPEEAPEYTLTADQGSVLAQQARILYAAAYRAREKDRATVLSAEGFFEPAPEGEFTWEDEVAGDWSVYNCGESDCTVGWHKVATATNMGRRADGTRWVTVNTVDEDGDWDYYAGWDESDGPEYPFEEFWADHIAQETTEYFIGWAEYWLNCAETGEDPLREFLRPVAPEDWFDACIKAAKDQIRYLEM